MRLFGGCACPHGPEAHDHMGCQLCDCNGCWIPALGDGTDGSAVLDGAHDVPWARRAGTTYLMTRDAHLTDLTVEVGVSLGGTDAPTAWILHCQGEILNRGTIHGRVVSPPAVPR